MARLGVDVETRSWARGRRPGRERPARAGRRGTAVCTDDWRHAMMGGKGKGSGEIRHRARNRLTVTFYLGIRCMLRNNIVVTEPSLDSVFQKWEQQLRKGLLSFLVLRALAKERHYGYSLMNVLSKTINADMAEGTIYPLLSRLKRDAMISSQWQIQPSGPARKYYEITDRGRALLTQMESHWQHLSECVEDDG